MPLVTNVLPGGPFIKDLHLFCLVVGNFRDIGMWRRPARHFMQEYGCAVML
jgi:hypothetical protein